MVLIIAKNLKRILKLVVLLIFITIVMLSVITQSLTNIFANYNLTDPGNPVFAGGYCFPIGVPFRYTSYFGEDRGDSSHHGVDLAIPIGSPLYSIKSGTISQMSISSIGGIEISIFGDDGRTYYYGHLNNYAPGIASGIRVTSGQIIGFSGNTGKSTGPHLHFGINTNNGWINPLPLLSSITMAISKSQYSFTSQPNPKSRELALSCRLSCLKRLNVKDGQFLATGYADCLDAENRA
jgi:hypothetical protein